MRRVWIAVLLVLVAAPASAPAQETRPPRLTHIHTDWSAVAAELSAADPAATDDAGDSRLARLNRASGEFFNDIAASPVPVLLPFDAAGLLKDRAAGSLAKSADDYLAGFHLSGFFLPGPSGYDAMFIAQATDLPGLGISFSGRIQVFISGLSLLYELDEPAGLTEWPARGLGADFPGLRRLFLENYVRYAFTRYGVPYVVSILCFDGSSRFHMISCREADKVAERFLGALRVAGGSPQPAADEGEPAFLERPAAASAEFAYHSPGDIIPGTGHKGQGGRADYTVYSRLRFPIAEAPAFANSQSFMNGGDCNRTGRNWLGMVGRLPSYRCRVGGPVLLSDEAAVANYSYPWRDNFCEHRDFDVGQCPGGVGHQGQDIRPSSCQQRSEGANHCLPYQHDVVAARDGMVLRAPGQMPVYLFVNAASEHIRLRYLHMFPRRLDEDGIITGRRLSEGEALGKVGNFFQHEGATSYHLHFDMQVPTKYGWVFVNPYMTLVAAYERLIGGRGREIKESPVSATAALPGADIPGLRVRPRQFAVQSEGDDRVEGADDEQPNPPLVPAQGDQGPRLGNGPRLADLGAGAEPETVLRPMGRGFSRAGARARNIRRNLYARHARLKAGHHRL
jgi:hypothetical protein